MSKTVSVIGGGLGALSGAIRLARMGFQVKIFEKNPTLGGKINEYQEEGYRFDTGPSLLTMPFIIDELFHFAGYRRTDFLHFIKIDPICRYFFDDGTLFDTSADQKKMEGEIERVFPKDANSYHKFLKYTQNIYETAAEIFLFTPLHEFRRLLKPAFLPLLFKIFRIDPLNTVNTSVTKFFNDPRLIKIFNRYATYNGSDPFKAPATLNIIPYVEYGLGGYYIDGGMYRLIETINSIATSMGIEIHTDTIVEKILHENGYITGIRVNGENIKSDYVLCGTDVVKTHQHLIDGYDRYSQKLKKLEPSLSGLVFLWGIRKVYNQLAHHNIFFSSDYRKEFRQIFDDLKAPTDPTIYLSITSKKNPEHAPQNCENWFILLNMPYLQEDQDWDSETHRLREVILKKLKSFGIDIKTYILFEKSYSPRTFLKLFASNKGSIYGTSSNTRLSAFMRPANRSRRIHGLYFAGGSVHPGGGIPLVTLSGKMAAELIAEKEEIDPKDFIDNTALPS